MPDFDASKQPNPLRDSRDRRLSRVAGPSSLVIFGVTGDLARKKLMPAVYDLANRGLAAAELCAGGVRPPAVGRRGLRGRGEGIGHGVLPDTV